MVLPFGHVAAIWIAGCAGRDGKSVRLCDNGLGLRRGAGKLRGGGETGDGEDDDEGADNILHDWTTPKVVCVY